MVPFIYVLQKMQGHSSPKDCFEKSSIGLYSNQLISIFVATQIGMRGLWNKPGEQANKHKHALSNNVPIQEMM